MIPLCSSSTCSTPTGIPTPNCSPQTAPTLSIRLRGSSGWHATTRVDLIYVNDNYGDFTAGSDDIVRSTLDGERPDLVKPIVPEKGCHFLTKARHSVFYATPLDYLLGRLDTKRLILTGQVTEQYILYSALDAYVRISPSWYRRMWSPTSTPTSVMPRCA